MSVYLSAGNLTRGLRYYLDKINDISIVKSSDTIDDVILNIKKNTIECNVLAILDYDYSSNFNRFKSNILELIKINKIEKFKIIVITRDCEVIEFIENLKLKHVIPVLINIQDKIKIEEVNQIILEHLNNGCQINKSMLDRILKLDDLSKKNSELRKVIVAKYNNSNNNNSKLIAVYGNRGSGVSSIVSTLGITLASLNIKTLILDLDITLKGMNIFFKGFGRETEVNKWLITSLASCFINPENFENNTYKANNNLYVSTLAYSLTKDEKILEKINTKNLAFSIESLKSNFDIILVDLPLEELNRFQELTMIPDRILLNLNNNINSIVSTYHYISQINVQERKALLNKVHLLCNKYNHISSFEGREFNLELVLGMLSQLSGHSFSNIRSINTIDLSCENEAFFQQGRFGEYDNSFKYDIYKILENVIL